MTFDALFDPHRLIERSILQACAKVRRESPEPAEYLGLLAREPTLGEPLVLALDQRRRLTTSPIQRIEPGPNHTTLVETQNSRYWIRRLGPPTVRSA